MRNFFSLDNPVMRFLDTMADLIILNILFIVGQLFVVVGLLVQCFFY